MPSPLVGEGESEGMFGHGARGRFPISTARGLGSNSAPDFMEFVRETVIERRTHNGRTGDDDFCRFTRY
jgi:hypothetical protein